MQDGRSPRILITRLSHIGDCIHTFPVATALRERFPDALIGWAVERAAAPLLENHEAVDELIVLQRGWLKSPSRVWRLRRQLRRLDFDVSIDPQTLTKSAIVGWLSGAKMRIGFSGKDGREFSKWLNNRLVWRTAPHVVDRYLQLLKPLGVESPKARFCVPVDEAADALVAGFVRKNDLSNGFAAINPGAGWDSKLWPADRYAAVAAHLGQAWSLPSVIVWAGDREQAWARQIVSGAGGHALLAPPTTLNELASLLRAARLFVGSDTGPLHLAAAVGTRCVALFGPTPVWQCGPYGPGHVAIQQIYHEASSRERRNADNAAMRAIQVGAVCDGCDQILGSQSTERAA